jgi:hypothetical protein
MGITFNVDLKIIGEGIDNARKAMRVAMNAPSLQFHPMPTHTLLYAPENGELLKRRGRVKQL